MPRPKKWRRVGYIPRIKIYGPLDADAKNSEVIIMSIEEFESIRLMDLEGLDQTQCAEKMMIARSTFQRIYTEAKKKMADCIVNGKILKVEGGNYTLNICRIVCQNCGHEWEEKYENINDGAKCPECGSDNNFICKRNNKNEVCGRCFRHRNGRHNN